MWVAGSKEEREELRAAAVAKLEALYAALPTAYRNFPMDIGGDPVKLKEKAVQVRAERQREQRRVAEMASALRAIRHVFSPPQE